MGKRSHVLKRCDYDKTHSYSCLLNRWVNSFNEGLAKGHLDSLRINMTWMNENRHGHFWNYLMIYRQRQLSERGWSAEPGRGEFELSFWRIISCPVSSSPVMQKIAILPKICQHVSALLIGLQSLFISPCLLLYVLHSRCWGMQYGAETPHKEKSTVNSVCADACLCMSGSE